MASSSGKAGINSQDLEECDICPEEDTTLVRFDGDNHNITNQVSGEGTLEECDICPEEATTLVRFDGDNQNVTNQVSGEWT